MNSTLGLSVWRIIHNHFVASISCSVNSKTYFDLKNSGLYFKNPELRTTKSWHKVLLKTSVHFQVRHPVPLLSKSYRSWNLKYWKLHWDKKVVGIWKLRLKEGPYSLGFVLTWVLLGTSILIIRYSVKTMVYYLFSVPFASTDTLTWAFPKLRGKFWNLRENKILKKERRRFSVCISLSFKSSIPCKWKS